MLPTASNSGRREGRHGVHEADRALVARMRGGDQRAFDEFFKTSAPRLAAFIARRLPLGPDTLEDVVQSALIKAVRNLGGYRGDAALSTWLAEICRRELADLRRKAARRPPHVPLNEPNSMRRVTDPLRAPQHQEPIAQLVASTRLAAVLRVFESLPPHYALALESKYGDGLSVDEIARQLGLTVVATQSVLARAREAFRQRWSRIWGDIDTLDTAL